MRKLCIPAIVVKRESKSLSVSQRKHFCDQKFCKIFKFCKSGEHGNSLVGTPRVPGGHFLTALTSGGPGKGSEIPLPSAGEHLWGK